MVRTYNTRMHCCCLGALGRHAGGSGNCGGPCQLIRSLDLAQTVPMDALIPSTHPPTHPINPPQSSGFGVKGSVGRCYPIWSAFEKCLATKDHFKECMDFRDDYVECLHHRKEVRLVDRSIDAVGRVGGRWCTLT